MNILISSVGRQVYLVNAFKDALEGSGKVIACDNNGKSAALEIADTAIVSPKFTSKNYMKWLLNICISKKVKFLLSLNVDELLILEQNRDLFDKNNIFLLGGDYDKIYDTYDKYRLYEMLKENGINVPITYLPKNIDIEKLNYPLIAKPRFGKGSRGIELLNNPEDLKNLLNKINDDVILNQFIIQEFVVGDEFGIDVINDFKRQYIGVLVRKKIEMKNGETFQAITITSKEWTELAKIISKMLKHYGNVDIDIISSNGKKYLLDINFRFGGGYIFNHFCGANLPKAYVDWIQEKEPDSSCFSSKSNIHLIRQGNSLKILSK
jgi:carbamoyl-phosphate synthase large subunit